LPPGSGRNVTGRRLQDEVARAECRLGLVTQVVVRGYAAPVAEPTTLHLTAVVTREGDWYVARCLEIEATSQGETVEQALDNLRDVVEVYLEEEPAPAAPQPPLVTSIDVRVPA
jgi:predicted RNase H-like HicB family nuclease